MPRIEFESEDQRYNFNVRFVGMASLSHDVKWIGEFELPPELPEDPARILKVLTVDGEPILATLELVAPEAVSGRLISVEYSSALQEKLINAGVIFDSKAEEVSLLSKGVLVTDLGDQV